VHYNSRWESVSESIVNSVVDIGTDKIEKILEN